ncbi:hypothetical protein FB451DRAFT_1181867 [Mycena latifolia]|nr:hypothetical protein FB451DRAFT_1181867 [Mycena latifolia]
MSNRIRHIKVYEIRSSYFLIVCISFAVGTARYVGGIKVFVLWDPCSEIHTVGWSVLVPSSPGPPLAGDIKVKWNPCHATITEVLPELPDSNPGSFAGQSCSSDGDAVKKQWRDIFATTGVGTHRLQLDYQVSINI